MWIEWPACTFALRLHLAESEVAGAVDGEVVLGADTGHPCQRWSAERRRGGHVRLRHAATGLYLTAESDIVGAGIGLRPTTADEHWLQLWIASYQPETSRFRLYNELSMCVLGLQSPATKATTEGQLVLEYTSGRYDTTCTAWAAP
jgi:hypothetical protein